ncbi:hypothetical protein MMC34_000631 [Xylographa carneopallida]|nr:hypothetical protein [Xylographa carneopallida]
MPPALKKRKVAATSTSKTNVARPVPKGGIAAFGRITKSNSAFLTDVKDLAVKQDALLGECLEQSEGYCRKRKIELPETPPKGEVATVVETKSTTVVVTAALDSTESEPSLPPLPLKPRKKVLRRAKKTETPTKGARAFLEAFALSSSSPSRRASSPLPSQDTTPPTSPASIRSPRSVFIATPCPAGTSAFKLPDEVQDLVDVHAAFLTALSLHYAHNGSFSPVDLRTLHPSTERAWSKRRIGTDDICLTLGILAGEGPQDAPPEDTACPLRLSDFGNGKICVELLDASSGKGQRRRPIDVEKLNSTFVRNLSRLWRTHASPDTPSFLAQLPRAPIRPCSSLHKISPLLAKGQRRLEDLKAGAIKAQRTIQKPTASVTQKEQVRPKLPSSRSSSLLERIQAKELYQSTLPSGPSPEAIARRNALQRLEEIIPVLEILTSSASRGDDIKEIRLGSASEVFSFTMPTMIQHLKMSLRNPISKDEAARCVGLLAEEIAPGWVGTRDVGKLKGVTVRSVSGIGREDMRRRIAEATGKRS